MSEIKLIEVKGVTSEDTKHVAENLLSKKYSGKWLSEKPRKSNQMEATFQLSEMRSISSVHIGNYGSAFVSFLVARSGSGNFETLLPCCEIRSMVDSKLGKNKETVHMFNSERFMENTRHGKWDQLRVVLMQPFNQEQFGLSFLNVYSFSENKPDANVETSEEVQKWNKLRNVPVLSKSPSLSRGSKLLQEARQKTSQPETKQTNMPNKERTPDKSGDKELLFKAKVYSFMDSLHLRVSDLEHLRLKQVEEGFEKLLERTLDKQEKSWFISAVRNYLKNLLQTKEKAGVIDSNEVQREKTKCNFSQDTNILERRSQSPNTPKSRKHNLNRSTTIRTLDKNGTEKPDINSSEKPSTSRTPDTGISSKRRNLVSLEDSLIKSERQIEKASVSDIIILDDSQDDAPATYIEPEQGQKRKLTQEESGIAEVEAKRECVAAFTECPICNGLFESSLIEAHSAECISFEGNEDYISKVPCPMCKKLVNTALVDVHADECARLLFGD